MPKTHKNARLPSHAGSWYDNDEHVLSGKIRSWLRQAQASDEERVELAGSSRGVIAPHAGYSYCGSVMAAAYKYIDPSLVKRIFLLGPSHHFYSRQCLLSPHHEYATPLGSAAIDARLYAELRATGAFGELTAAADEAEHSLELHMPYLMEVMRDHPFTLVPIVVGALTAQAEADYGRLLAPYLSDPANFFVVSSDFCHWGARFNFTFYQRERGEIHQSIEWLDREGMALIEAGDAASFTAYLQRYGNTICGRHPIGVFLNALQASAVPHAIKFTRYAQSHRCTLARESSVSYASAVVSLVPAANGNV